MKMVLRSFYALMAAALVALGLFAGTASAEVLVVDSDRLWNETAVGKDVQKQLKEFQEKLDGKLDLKTEQEKLKADAEGLKTQQERKIISEEVFREKAIELRKREVAFNNAVQQRQVLLGAATRNAQAEFYKAIRPTLLEVVEKRKGSMLIEASQTLYNNDGSEITGDAIKAIDQKLKKLKIELPQEKAEAAKKEKKN